MRNLAILVLVLMLVLVPGLPGTVWANPLPWAEVGFYGDAEGMVHTVYDSGPGTLDIYVVLRNYVHVYGAGTVRFSAPPPPCFDAVYLGESSSFGVIGDSQAGAWVFPLDCSQGAYHIMTITWTVQGGTSECCWFEPRPFPGATQVEGTDCSITDFEWIAAEGVWINPNSSINCNSPVEATTWGAIKAMYR
jgi:hypothetical protein